MYGAMWDECVFFILIFSLVFLFLRRYDEGTAFMPVVETKRLLPESDKFPFMALDEDGYDLPSDWSVTIYISKFKH
jgi:hypothetical protein